MSHNTKSNKEILREFDVLFDAENYPLMYSWLEKQLTLKDTEKEEAVREEREEIREILQCVSRMINASAINLENYILGQMPPLPESDKTEI